MEREKGETEITPEMIEAGKLALVTHDPERFSMDEIIVSVWTAMALAKSAAENHRDSPSPGPSESS